MKLFVAMACVWMVIALARSAPAASSEASLARRALPALQHEEVHDSFGQYALRYVTAEGSVVAERGRLVPTASGEGHVLVYEGEYSFRGDDGRTYVTKYRSDQDGFHVDADHLPKAPEPIN